MNSLIKGLKVLDNDIQMIYYNEQMLKDGIVIEVETGEYGNNIETVITIHHINKVEDSVTDATSYTMYWDDMLAPIQEHRLIKDIYEMYTDNSISTFIEIMHGMSTSMTSASMQSDPRHAENVLNSIMGVFELVYDFI